MKDVALGLIVLNEKPKWTGGKALVPVPRDACPQCSGALMERSYGEMSLFVHGGYGATRTTIVAWCHCGWSIVRSTTETNPRRDAA